MTTSKILGGITMDVPPFINIGGTCPPCPIGIDARDGSLAAAVEVYM